MLTVLQMSVCAAKETYIISNLDTKAKVDLVKSETKNINNIKTTKIPITQTSIRSKSLDNQTCEMCTHPVFW